MSYTVSTRDGELGYFHKAEDAHFFIAFYGVQDATITDTDTGATEQVT